MRFPQPGRVRLAALLAALPLLAAPPVRGEEPGAEAGAGSAEQITEEEVLAIAFDALLLRPMGFLQTVIGVAVMPLAWLLAIPGGLENDVIELLVTSPAEHTFLRPLGELS